MRARVHDRTADLEQGTKGSEAVTELDSKYVELATRNSQLERELRIALRAKEDLQVALTIIDMAYSVLDANGPDAIVRAKGLLSSYIEDQMIANGL
jgi:hypothetical protein